GESMINAVIDVVAGFAVAPRLADNSCDSRGRGRNNETARLGQDLNIGSKQAINFRVDLAGQSADRLDVGVVSGRKADSDVQDLDFMAALLRFLHHRGG